jgi:hypothetical protein
MLLSVSSANGMEYGDMRPADLNSSYSFSQSNTFDVGEDVLVMVNKRLYKGEITKITVGSIIVGTTYRVKVSNTKSLILSASKIGKLSGAAF